MRSLPEAVVNLDAPFGAGELFAMLLAISPILFFINLYFKVGK